MRGILFLLLIVVSVSVSATITSESDSLKRIASSDSIEQKMSIKSHEKVVADSAYIRNDYALAIQIYEEILKKGEAADIYYNLGNSYYKTNEIGKAILNYERALLLQPNNSDIKANLEIARAKSVDKVEVMPEVFFVTWTRNIINLMNVDSWAICAIIAFIMLIIAISIFMFSKSVLWKKISFFGALFCLALTICANIFASQQKKLLMNRDNAIVISPSVTVRSTPSENGTSLFILHEGRKVSIKDNSMRAWKEIRLEDGKVGWVPAESIEVI